MTKIVRVEMQDIDNPVLQEAANIMLEGGLVVFPTETVYGLGTIAENQEAARSVFRAKHREHTVPLPVQIASAEMLSEVAENVSQITMDLAAHFWPGALTMVVKKNPNIPDCVTSGQPTVGVRIPDHPIALSLLRKAGIPIIATSANTSGCSAPVTAQQAAEQLGDRVEVIIDSGQCSIGTSSTVISIVGDEIRILRQGTITLADIYAAIGR